MTYKRVDLSGADSVGVLYFNDENYLRGIENNEIENINRMFEDGFIETLQSKRLIPGVKVFEGVVPGEMKQYDLILQHEAISPITYPREWSFYMTKAAVLAYLEIAEVAFALGYCIKDCHLFNFVFDGLQPLWVDIGSFIKVKSKNSIPFPLTVFKSSILTPMKIWSDGAQFMGSSLLASPVNQLSQKEVFIYNYPWARKSLFIQKILTTLSKIQQKFNKTLYSDSKKALEKFRNKVSSLSVVGDSMWDDYHSEFLDPKGNFVEYSRFNRIIELLAEFNPNSVLELAGNAGVLSELILNRCNNTKVICTDYDSLAIDALFLRLAPKGTQNLLGAKLNFMVTEYSSDEIAPEERFRSECVLALAVTHHLVLTQGYTFDAVFEKIKQYSKRLVFIEYMPLGLWNGSSAPPLPDGYSQKKFEDSFCDHFELLKFEQLDENRILFVGQIRV